MPVEKIAGDDDHVHGLALGHPDYPLEGLVLRSCIVATVAEMEVGGVQDLEAGS
jgi:hypothetical protein